METGVRGYPASMSWSRWWIAVSGSLRYLGRVNLRRSGKAIGHQQLACLNRTGLGPCTWIKEPWASGRNQANISMSGRFVTACSLQIIWLQIFMKRLTDQHQITFQNTILQSANAYLVSNPNSKVSILKPSGNTEARRFSNSA